VRVVSGVLALAWLGGGSTAIVFAVRTSDWLPAVFGIAGLLYGLLWLRVMWLGRQLTARDALMPWRASRRRDA
jgi:hypothetical protein